MTKRNLLIKVSLVVLLTLPLWVKNLYHVHILITVFLNVTLAISLTLMFKMGYLNLGQAAYVGIGAYTSAILGSRFCLPFFLTFWLAGMVSGIIALCIGRLTLGLRGIYFTITAFAFTEVFRGICSASKEFLGGPGGIMNIALPLQMEPHMQFYYIAIFLMGASLFVILKLSQSSFGLLCSGLSVNEIQEECVGVNTRRIKTVVFVLSSVFAGFVGSIMAHYLGHISPANFTMHMSIDVVAYCAIGGMLSVTGAVIGAIFLTLVNELLYGVGFFRIMVTGFILIVVVLTLPGGLISLPYRGSRIRWH